MVARLPTAVRSRLLDLIAADGGDELEDGNGSAELASIRAGQPQPEHTMLTEIARLQAVRAVGLPADVFAEVAPKVIAGWRARATMEAPSHLREHPPRMTVTLQREIHEGLNVVESWNRANAVPTRTGAV